MYENLNDPIDMHKEIKLYGGSGNPELANKIADVLHLPLSGLKLEKFANGEIYARYASSVRGADVFLIQSVCSGNGFDVNKVPDPTKSENREVLFHGRGIMFSRAIFDSVEYKGKGNEVVVTKKRNFIV